MGEVYLSPSVQQRSASLFMAEVEMCLSSRERVVKEAVLFNYAVSLRVLLGHVLHTGFIKGLSQTVGQVHHVTANSLGQMSTTYIAFRQETVAAQKSNNHQPIFL